MSDRATESQTLSRRVFLCHSSTDKEAVRRLYAWLRENGVVPWLDEEDILPGQSWEYEIRKAVRMSSMVIVCLSHSSVAKAGYVNKEIKYALDVADEQPEGRIFIIPVKLEECQVPERLAGWQWVNIFEPRGYDRLLKALSARGVVGSAPPASNKLRLAVHRAFFASGPECFFVNATNIGAQTDLEITHIWFETKPPFYFMQPDRPLPKRLRPQETWETWVRVDALGSRAKQQIFTTINRRDS